MNGSGEVVLEGRGVSKYYGTVVALESVDVEIKQGRGARDRGRQRRGQVNAREGAVWSGSSPTKGEVVHRGEVVQFDSPHEARARGIETVWQDLALAANVDVAGNIYLGREILRGKWGPRLLRVLNRKAMAEGAAERLQGLRVTTIPTVAGLPTDLLSGGQRQSVAVARAAAWATDVLFMDEPTAALGVKQSKAVLDLARRVARQGLGVVVITHALPHVMEVSDRIVVLRHGRMVANLMRTEATPERIVSLIVGFERGDVTDGE